jgi:hypothetical protein
LRTTNFTYSFHRISALPRQSSITSRAIAARLRSFSPGELNQNPSAPAGKRGVPELESINRILKRKVTKKRRLLTDFQNGIGFDSLAVQQKQKIRLTFLVGQRLLK